MTPPKHLSDEQKRVFREIVKKAKSFRALEAIDTYQIEQVAIHVVTLRDLSARVDAARIDPSVSEEDYLRLQRSYTSTNVSMNASLDKLGLSQAKRAPKSAPRGRPPATGSAPPTRAGKSEWDKVLKVVDGGKGGEK